MRERTPRGCWPERCPPISTSSSPCRGVRSCGCSCGARHYRRSDVRRAPARSDASRRAHARSERESGRRRPAPVAGAEDLGGSRMKRLILTTMALCAPVAAFAQEPPLRTAEGVVIATAPAASASETRAVQAGGRPRGTASASEHGRIHRRRIHWFEDPGAFRRRVGHSRRPIGPSSSTASAVAIVT